MNDQNLIPFSERTESEQREIRSKGGRASGAKRRENKKISDAMALVMSLPAVNDDLKAVMTLMGIQEDSQEIYKAIAVAAAIGAQDGDLGKMQFCAEMNRESIKREELELRKAELKEKRRHNKAEEAAKQRELDIRERELENKQGLTEDIKDAYTENLISLLQKDTGQGLGEDD